MVSSSPKRVQVRWTRLFLFVAPSVCFSFSFWEVVFFPGYGLRFEVPGLPPQVGFGIPSRVQPVVFGFSFQAM